MTQTELRPSPERHDQQPYGWLAIVVVAALVAVFSALSQHRPATPTVTAPVAPQRPAATLRPVEPSASATPSPAASTLVGRGPLTIALNTVDVCKPVTDGTHSLVVDAVIQSMSSVRITLTDVRATLPLGGLVAGPVTVRTGTCMAATSTPFPVAGFPLEPGDSMLVSFHFTLPRTCPAALPIRASVSAASGPTTITTDLPVLPDLGGVHFARCGKH